jgi:hypothetical protein
LLGFTEKEVWKMTVRQIHGIFQEYCYFNGLKKRDAGGDDD